MTYINHLLKENLARELGVYAHEIEWAELTDGGVWIVSVVHRPWYRAFRKTRHITAILNGPPS